MTGALFVRPSKKGEDDDSDDEQQQRKRARRELRRQNHGTTVTLPELASAIRTQCNAAHAVPASELAPLLRWTLRPFQVSGVAWMQRMLLGGFGVVLADEMGLGKTMQSIATYIALSVSEGVGGGAPLVVAKKLLVIAPLSVVPTWIAEFKAAVEDKVPLRVWRYGGAKEERDLIISKVEASIHATPQPTVIGGQQAFHHTAFDVLVTTPEYLISDAFFLAKISFDMIVFDEAHRLKNAQTRLYQMFAQHYLPHIMWRVLLTGTPLSNSPLELWSLMRLVNLERFSACRMLHGVDADGEEAPTLAAMERYLQVPDSSAALRQLSECLLLRRLKADVLVGMPPITEVLLRVPMSPLQLKLYSGIITKNAQMLASIFQSSPMGGGGDDRRPAPNTSLLNTVIQLRKCCNHPYMFSGVEPEPFTMGDHLIRTSNKMVLLDKLLKKLHAEGHRVLLFSQFAVMLDILQDYLEYRGYSHVRLDGSVRGEDREVAVHQFQAQQVSTATVASAEVPFVFLLSTRAGGVGLTLTAADTVIFYDHDWNPQMDLQAQQRAHRIGQTKPVTVYRLCSHHSVEEGILAVAARKLKVASEYVIATAKGADAEDGGKLSVGEIQRIVRLAVAAMPQASHHVDGGGEDGGAAEKSWASFVDDLSIEALLAASTNASCATVDLDGALSTAEEQQAFQATMAKLKDDALLARSAAGEAGGDNRRERRNALVDEDEVSLEAAGARRKRTEAERLASMRNAWSKRGYVTSGLPSTMDTYEAIDDEGDSIMRQALLHHAATVCSAAQLAALFPPPSANAKGLRDVAETHSNDQAPDDDGTASDVSPVVHLRGDLFHPVADTPKTLRLIVVPVNNSGVWGSGRLFNSALAIAPLASEQYRRAKEHHDLRLGDAHLIWATENPTSVQVILAVIQKSKGHGASNGGGGGEVDLKALTVAMARVAAYAAFVKQRQQWRTESRVDGPSACGVAVSFHFPLFAALSKDAAYALDKILAKYTAAGERCYTYHAPPRSGPTIPRRRPSPQQPVHTMAPQLALAAPSQLTMPSTANASLDVALQPSEDEAQLTMRPPLPSWRLSKDAARSVFIYATLDPMPSKALLARAVLSAGGVFASLEEAQAYLLEGEDSANFVVVCDTAVSVGTSAPVAGALRSFVLSHSACTVVDVAWLLAHP